MVTDNLHITAHTLPAEPWLLARTHDGNSGMETPGLFKHGEMDLGIHYINSNIMRTPVLQEPGAGETVHTVGVC